MPEAVNLSGVPATMLWTLHNRACESRRPDTYLRDPDCVRVYESIDHDFEGSFGRPRGSHPMRSRIVDDLLRPWLSRHPGGTVVELGAGLETQFQRCDDGRVQWRCVDVPEAIAVRERFLPSTDRCRHLACSALDLSWLDAIDPSRGVFVTAQGLLMYLDEPSVRGLFVAVVMRLPGVEIVFDTIPPWLSRRSLQGPAQARPFQAPPMPWGVARSDIEPLLRGWSDRVTRVTTRSYGEARGRFGALIKVLGRVPGLRDGLPAITHVQTRPV